MVWLRCWTLQQGVWCEACTARASCLERPHAVGAAQCRKRSTRSLVMTFSCLRKSPSPWDTGGTLMDLAQTQADAMDLAQTQADAKI